MSKNTLYYGDNIDILPLHIANESVDLIYLDPPFNSKQTYNLLFKERDGSRAAAQIKAFTDTWRWDQGSEAAYRDVVEKGPSKVSLAVQALRQMLGENDMMAYVAMMAPRLLQLHRVLKPTGSLYLHCDPTASHYLKLVLDAMFGPKSFRNEIVWKRTPFAGSSKARAEQYPRSHDVIFFYTKGDLWAWNRPAFPYTEKYLKRFKWDDGDGRGPYRKTLLKTYSEETFERLKKERRLIAPVKAGAMYSYKQYLKTSSGNTQVDDLWLDVNSLNPVAAERLGYPTQKPRALLERIIAASSNKGDVVLDPFCGCGTAIEAAQKLGRKWIGIDITHLAIALIRHRLVGAFGSEIAKTYEVKGEPVDLSGAQELAKGKDRYPFQWWALGLVGARPAPEQQKKGADKGIDGHLFFHDDREGAKAKHVILSVKSGKLKPDDVRALAGVIGRDEATLGVLISLEEPTPNMKADAAAAGFYQSPGWHTKHPRVQILTVEDLLNGKRIDMPPIGQTNVTFKKAPRVKSAEAYKPKSMFDRADEEE